MGCHFRNNTVPVQNCNHVFPLLFVCIRQLKEQNVLVDLLLNTVCTKLCNTYEKVMFCNDECVTQFQSRYYNPHLVHRIKLNN